MGVIDLWVGRDGQPTKRHGRGLQFRVTHPGHPTKSFRTKTEADRHWRKLASTPIVPAESVGAMVKVWQAGKAHLARKTVLAAKADAARVMARWGRTPVSQVRGEDVQVWIATMTSQRGKGDNLVVRPAANATRAKALQCLAGAMEIAIARGMVDKNPCRGINPGRQTRMEPQFLEPDELVDLAAAAGRDRGLVMLLGMTGLRIGEAAALDVGDVDVKRRRIRIRRSKTGRARDVPVPATVLELLDLDRPRTAPLFTSARGDRIDVDNWRARVWVDIAPRGLRIHDLRHTAASLAIASGADVKVVQRMLGHATAAMTLDLYGHLRDGSLDDVAARMDAMINRGVGKESGKDPASAERGGNPIG